ncbi:hypothetical protein M2447_002365 [Ereboglobus sp. PH5-10]|uniref:hypothetical protein n=1 Tax=Ereboglobus sp. PH5-10 TaxID=2940629 RepID=UPI002405495C|nr:hypothetical protein [Ereboglobus sp. PH5-10]MDF9828247.1 hypothetical protein [Ereboglobus sp. PH5-10]
MKTKYKLEAYGNQTDPKMKNISAHTDDKTIYFNMNFTVAYLNSAGTLVQFLALTILHEATHIGYVSLDQPSGYMNEESVPYWVADWAIRNNIPETDSGYRDISGSRPDFKQIYNDVIRNGSYKF